VEARRKAGHDVVGFRMNKNVAIVGAGIGGLAAALALIRQGVGVDV
jgi:cation diffusion facilitator CzcD-associated flavoprotein CzcO